MLRLSHDGGATWTEDVVVAADPRNETWFWDQRLAVHPETGELVAMFWTFDRVAGRDLPIHIAWGSPGRAPLDGPAADAARRPALPAGGARGSGRQRAGGDVHPPAEPAGHPGRRDPTTSGGRGTWTARSRSYGSAAGAEPAAEGGSQQDYWNAMGAWQFGHPRGVFLPEGEVFVTFYGGSGTARSARWARVEV